MAKQLVKTETKDTTLDLEAIWVVLKANPLELTDEERETLGLILQRFDRMRSKRVSIDRVWQVATLQYEAQFIPYADGRARSNVPLEWAIIELFVSEAMARDSKANIAAENESDVEKAEIMRRVVDCVDKQSRVKNQMWKNEFITAIYGTSFYLTGYTESSRVISDPTDDGGWKKKMLQENRIIIKALDPRNVYLDDRTIDFDDDNDQILIDYLTPEQVKALAYNDFYKNIDKVSLGNKSDQVFYTKEERGMMNDQIIEIMHYWNKAADRYVVIANRQVIIRDTPNPYAHKKLPIIPRAYGYYPLQKYGRGICEALLNFKSNYNILQEMIMDGIRRSNNSMFVLANGLTFDGDGFGFNNQIVEAQGSLDDNSYKEIKGQAPNQAIFNYAEDLLKQVAIFVGIDPSQIIGQASSTAFETAVKQESGLKRVNVALMSRDMALERVYNLYVSNIMQFFPIKTAKGLLDIAPDGSAKGKGQYPTIMLDNEKHVEGKFVKDDGRFPLEIKPEMIRGQYDITVETNFNTPTLKQLKLQRYSDFADSLMKFSQVMQIPSMTEKVPFDDVIEEMAFDFDIDLQSFGGMSDSVKKQKDQLMSQVRQMAGASEQPPAQWAPQQAGATQAPIAGQPPTGAEMPQPEGVRQNVNGISVPNVPGINGSSSAVNTLM